jgi:membrane protease YdiL (CAAX protease family)
MAEEELARERTSGGFGLIRAVAETSLATAVGLELSLRLDTDLPWLFLPLAVIALCRRSLAAYGFDLRLRPPAVSTHLVLGAALLAGYGALHTAFAVVWQHRSFAPRFPPASLLDLPVEFLSVAVPEEAFFRGYLQARWNRELGRRWRAFGALIGPGLFVQAAVFAGCHALLGDWTRLGVFFFALLAGWLRERSGSILAPAVYHAAANVWYQTLGGAFR